MKDIDLIEQQKENITPFLGGRSVQKLTSQFRHKSSDLQRQREQFETQLEDLDELDDPLQVFVDYISWMHHSYPQSQAPPELVSLLERATQHFKDEDHYHNDPRFVKICLDYCRATDIPREMLVYMSKKGIGSKLAVFYEEFGRHLEVQGKIVEADQVYQMGIDRCARPKARLERSWREFCTRTNRDQSPPPKRGLAGTSSSFHPSPQQPVKRAKLAVFNDHSESSSLLDVLTSNDIIDPFGENLHDRVKENQIAPTQWVGETIKQKIPVQLSARTKIPVFQDEVEVPKGPEITHTTTTCGTITVSRVPGKHEERIHVNTKLLWKDDEELCPLEVLLSSTIDNDPTLYRPAVSDAPASPTVTVHGRDSKQQVQQMFDMGAETHDSFDEDMELRAAAAMREPTENFTDFVTVTSMTAPDSNRPATPATAPASEASSPFTLDEHPPIEVFDIGDTSIRDNRLNSMRPSNCPGYHDKSSRANNKAGKYSNVFKQGQPKQASSAALIDFCGDEMYMIKSELGEGGYGTVYLVESDTGTMRALKVETPASKWEYYILKEVESRTHSSDYYVKPYELYHFADESWLFMEYCPQFSLIDLVNHYKNTTGKAVPEAICMAVAIELLRAVEQLHHRGILHGDFKPDNVMVRMSGSGMSVTLIDFGRAVDLRLYPENAQFISNYANNGQDCPAMQHQQSWSYDADYFGVAAVIYCMLFGDFIKVIDGETITLAQSLKRYWQQDLWRPLFTMLLNPYQDTQSRLPLTTAINFHINKLNAWITRSQGDINTMLVSLERELAAKRRCHENR